jgi:hypothetical protein
LKGCIVAGLFRINLPFVPHTVSDGNYEMIDLVYLANHTLGDEELLKQRSFKSYGPSREGNFVII